MSSLIDSCSFFSSSKRQLQGWTVFCAEAVDHFSFSLILFLLVIAVIRILLNAMRQACGSVRACGDCIHYCMYGTHIYIKVCFVQRLCWLPDMN